MPSNREEISGLHAIQKCPVAAPGQAVVQPMASVALTCDHGIVDGREAVLLLRRVNEVVGMSARMLVEV